MRSRWWSSFGVIDGGGFDAGFGSSDLTDQFGAPIIEEMSAKSDLSEKRRDNVVFNWDGLVRSD